jgi:hypothetical protein
MIRLERSRPYRVRPEAAFTYITDPRNWHEYWPNLVAILGPNRARWSEPGDTVRLRMRLAGRNTELFMTLQQINVPSLVTYRTVQAGLPDAQHERHFEPTSDGLVYRIVVTYTPRAGLPGLFDRTIVRRGIDRALSKTLDNLDRRLARGKTVSASDSTDPLGP